MPEVEPTPPPLALHPNVPKQPRARSRLLESVPQQQRLQRGVQLLPDAVQQNRAAKLPVRVEARQAGGGVEGGARVGQASEAPSWCHFQLLDLWTAT